MVKTPAVLFGNYIDAGEPTSETFNLSEVEVPEHPSEGEVLLELIYISIDPYMRGRMRNVPGYFVGPFQPGQPITGIALALVKESKAAEYPEGTYVRGFLPWQDKFAVKAEDLGKMNAVTLTKEKVQDLQHPLSVFLGVLGMTGMTAYGSLKKIGKPQKGETVFVSGAAGAVGNIVGQLCKNVYGCRVVGSAGSDEKCQLLEKEYGFDAVFNYKKTDTAEALAKHCPNGIDVYFDNVGGETLEAALSKCNDHARVVACGAISQYNEAGALHQKGVRNLFLVVTKRILMQGFIAGDFSGELAAEFDRDMSAYVKEGKVKPLEHIVAGGLPKAGEAFIDMMRGGNIGKSLVQCGADPFRK